MTQRWWFGGVSALALAVAGCSVSTADYNDASGVGGAVVGTLGAPPQVPSPPAMGAFLQGATGQRLAEGDRERAFQAELDALGSGVRTSWKGAKGAFGYVVPEAPGPDGCRTFAHTVYIGGRPASGGGTGCPAPGGGWIIAG